ncbi:MAG: methyltransferase domain-containing protein [Candidatus Omnitrophica bacterium]|nr:methyltransferase domain-containing protein [Candidatus Omnitrophota bacterium]
MDSSYLKAIAWIKAHTLDERGVMVSSKQQGPYLEVTGYLIPTLINAQEISLAFQYAEFLSYMQRPNGSFVGPDGNEYVFDSGQALRGLVAASQQWDQFKAFALKCADYLVSAMSPEGRWPVDYKGEIPEAVHLFVLPALVEASVVLNKPEYKDAALKALHYYKNQPDVLNKNCLTHFLAYIIDGFIDMGEIDFVRGLVNEIFKAQKSDGSIPAFPKKHWVCSVGLAQLGIIAHKFQMYDKRDRVIEYLKRQQNSSGGFFGSYGFGARYFPKEEISWASKFFIDLMHLQQVRPSSDVQVIKSLDNQEWHKVMLEETIDELAGRIKKNSFPLWCKPLLQNTKPGDSVLELGSGSGELSAVLSLYGRKIYLMDYSPKSIEYSKALFLKLGLEAQFFEGDILKDLPLSYNSVDWVFSSGVLEHFSEEEVMSIMKKSANAARRGVMSLVPNSQSLFYRIGKYAKEKSGQWPYGKETPLLTMKPYFEAALLTNIQEFSIGTYHALKFFGKDQKAIRAYLDSLTPAELKQHNQGYLLFTYGEKNTKGDSPQNGDRLKTAHKHDI